MVKAKPSITPKVAVISTPKSNKKVNPSKKAVTQKSLPVPTTKSVITQTKKNIVPAPNLVITPEEMAKRKKSLRFLLQLNDIPEASKAVIRAKYKALENLQAIPKLGAKPEIQLSYLNDQNKGITAANTLNHLGNNQYMNTLTIESGFQHFHIGALKFTKRIDSIFDGKKAIVIIDATDLNNPIFEVYPVSIDKPDHFIY